MRGPNRKSANVALLIFVAVVLFSNSSIHGYTPIIVKPFGEVSPKLYIIALDGVDAHGVGNMTRMLNGALDACRVNFTTQYVPSAEPITYAKLEISTNVTIVRDWDQYKEIVESSSKAIIVNAHGETIPIPTNYSKEAWIDKIADAMANRNVTWVHTAGYPFYYYHNEGSSEAEWGEEGFRRLMSHIGKSNITCNYDPSLSGTERLMLNVYAESSGLIYGWPDILGAYRV